MSFEVERDADLRGYWVKGLTKINRDARRALLLWDGEGVFIPDSLLRVLMGIYEDRRARTNR